MTTSNPIGSPIEKVPSAEALTASMTDRVVDDIEWVQDRLRRIGATDMKFAGELICLAQTIEEDGATPFDAAIAAAVLVIDALNRDMSGEQLDRLHLSDSPEEVTPY